MPSLLTSNREANTRWKKRFVIHAGLVAVCHYGVWVFLGAILIVLAAVPVGGALDWLILGLTDLRGVIAFPRDLWRTLWMSEQTPGFVNWLARTLASLSWGIVFALWMRHRERKLERIGAKGGK